jgi:HK97 family phage major capsid protein
VQLTLHLLRVRVQSQPQGIVTGSALGKTAAGATAITADDLLDLIYSVDASYRNKPGFGLMAHDNIISAVRALGLGSANDFPIFIPSMEMGQPDRIFGCSSICEQRYAVNYCNCYKNNGSC